MSQLIIIETRNTPAVLFDISTKCFRVSGHSIPENAGDFYTPVLNWLNKNLAEISSPAVFEFNLPYFNSSSLKALYLILKAIKKEITNGKAFEVVWFIEEDDDFMTEAAETFEEMVGLKLTLDTGIIGSTDLKNVA